MVNRTGHLTVPPAVPASTAHFPDIAKVAGFGTRLCRRWLRELKIQRAIRELEQLNDHTLKDIGLQRGAIEGRIRTAFGSRC